MKHSERRFSLSLLFIAILISISGSVPTGPFLRYSDLEKDKPYTVTADDRSWIINGSRTILLGGSIHYPRLSVGQWKPILSKMIDDGLNHAEVYTFWNLHEPLYDFSGKHIYNYSGRANLSLFLETAKEVGLFVNLRIGPYVCAEWSFGGLPTWLLHVNNISFRDANPQWESYMETYVQEIASISQPYLAQNGGPIIMAQIENEYRGSTSYVNWCGQLTTKLNMNVSWIMCNGESASNTINTCNGNNCYNYAKSHNSNYPGQPLGWTENEGWFQWWSLPYNADETGFSNRSPEDMAYSVALWFAAGAAHHNYYMWYGGNHQAWTAGASVSSMYADGVNLHSDGLDHEPKKTHLKRLHNILAIYGEYPMMESPIGIGNEIPLNCGNNNTFSLKVQNCDTNNQNQQWIYDLNTGLLKLSAYNNNNNNTHCVISTGNSDPVMTTICDINNKHEKWTYDNTDLQFKSNDNSCLDIFEAATNANIDEFKCKNSSSSDAKNQQWIIDSNTKQIKSKLNGQCLTASEIVAFAYQYHSKTKNINITFLCNIQSFDLTVEYKENSYFLNETSVTILDNDNNILYNTAIVNSTGLKTKRIYTTINDNLKYSSWTEQLPLYENKQSRPDKAIMNKTPFEQIRFTNDTFEYLFYSTNFTLSSTMNNVILNITGRKANGYIIYIDDEYRGEIWDGNHGAGNIEFQVNISGDITSSQQHTLTIISSSLGIANGIQNQQPASAQDMKGIVGHVLIILGNNNMINLTDNKWNHWIGRTGERLNVAGDGINKIQWKSPYDNSNGLTWYKTTFMTPSSTYNNYPKGTILVDIGSNGNGMKRGHWYLNGRDMGHYNNVILNNLMVQQYYFIPNDYLISTNNGGINTLIFAEELQNALPNSTKIVYSTIVVP